MELVSCAGHLISQGNTQIYEVIKEAGLNMGLLSGDADNKKEEDTKNDNEDESSSKPSSSGAGVVETIQKQGAQVQL